MAWELYGGGPWFHARAALFPKMPLFQYRSNDGEEREVLLPHDPPATLELDGKAFSRVLVVPFSFRGAAKQPTMGDEVMRGYREQEIILGSRFHSKLRPETIKRAWANDAPDE